MSDRELDRILADEAEKMGLSQAHGGREAAVIMTVAAKRAMRRLRDQLEPVAA